jgi:hypothetical protein
MLRMWNEGDALSGHGVRVRGAEGGAAQAAALLSNSSCCIKVPLQKEGFSQRVLGLQRVRVRSTDNGPAFEETKPKFFLCLAESPRSH